MKKVNLFAYAQLKPPSKYAPKTKTRPKKAAIHADMYKLKGDAGVSHVGRAGSMADGKVLKITPKKFKSLTNMEKPQFKAVKTKTTKKQAVEVFEDMKKIPKKAKRITSFRA